MKFGIECEVQTGGGALAEALYASGVKGDDLIHAYHCSCQYCRYNRSDYDWTVQADSTCGGEAISRILTWGEHDDAVATLAEGMRAARTTAGERAGNHIHVNRAGFERGSMAEHNLLRLYMRYEQRELAAVATGWQCAVRGYNSPNATHQVDQWWNRADRMYGEDLDIWPSGSWFVRKTGTFEFRLWNSTRLAWRIHLHAGLSVAMVEAALDGVKVTRNDRRKLSTVLGPYMDTRTAEYLKSQLKHVGF